MKVVSALAALLIVFFVSSAIYEQMNKKSAKSTRLDCHKKSIVFERVNNPKLISQLQELLKSSEVIISTRIEKAKYMQSTLFEYIDEKNVKELLKRYIKAYNKDNININKNITIDLLIYENDKKDPGKKTKKSKLYAGYLVFDFKLDRKNVYKIQIDFMDLQGRDISEKLKCALKSVMSVKGV